MSAVAQSQTRTEPPAGESFAVRGLSGMLDRLRGRRGAVVLDLGLLSQSRLDFLAGRCSLRVRVEDLVRQSTDGDLEKTVQNLLLPAGALDGALVWNLIEYLNPETAVALIDKIRLALKPGGMVAGLFRAVPPQEKRILQFEMPIPDRIHIEPRGLVDKWRLLSNRDVLQAFGDLDAMHSYSLKSRYTEFLFKKVERQPESMFD